VNIQRFEGSFTNLLWLKFKEDSLEDQTLCRRKRTSVVAMMSTRYQQQK